LFDCQMTSSMAICRNNHTNFSFGPDSNHLS